MIKLSDRLQLIADLINKGETMADIGTDHGFLPLYLIEKGISPKAVMCDISGPSLDKAVEASEKYDIKSGAEFRKGDGLDILEKGEVDVVVIAGMGGKLITEIIGADLCKSKSFCKYILQPRNNAALLRYWLEDNGFELTENHIVREGKFICEVILALVPKDAQIECKSRFEPLPGESDPLWDLPGGIICDEPGLLEDFVELKLRQEQKKLDGITISRNADEGEIETIRNRIEYFRRYLNDRI